jgi:hypothetical protein
MKGEQKEMKKNDRNERKGQRVEEAIRKVSGGKMMFMIGTLFIVIGLIGILAAYMAGATMITRTVFGCIMFAGCPIIWVGAIWELIEWWKHGQFNKKIKFTEKG